MKQLYLLRHGEQDSHDRFTEDTINLAAEISKRLPPFATIVSSGVERAFQTPVLLINEYPTVDDRAGYFLPVEEHGQAIHNFGVTNGMNFIDVVEAFQGGKLAEGTHAYAAGLNELVDETLDGLSDGESALIVSHDLTISTAMALRGLEKVSSNFLHGYLLDEAGQATTFPG